MSIGGTAAAARERPALAGPEVSRQWKTWIAAAVVLAALPHVPGLDSDFGRSLLSQMGIAAVFALSYNVLFGETGLLSFGHAVYFGLGGYAAIHAMRAINHGLGVPIALVPLAGAAGGLVVGILFGALTTRRAGTIFALISLGVGELVYAATFMLPGIFGGEEGITASRTKAPALLGLQFGSQLEVYYLIALWALVAALAMRAFTRTPAGRMCNAVRDNPERAEFIGYDPARVRFIAFSVAGMFAGLAGGLHAINYEIVAADAVGAQRSGSVLLMAYVGGAGHFAGPIVGAVALTWLQTSLSAYTSAWMLYVGLMFIAIVLYVPSGLVGLLLMHGAIARTAAFRRVLAGYAISFVPAVVMACGAVVLIEMGYRLSTQRELGTVLRFGRVTVDASTATPWVAGALMLAIGAFALRRTWRFVSSAWEQAGDEARAARTAAEARR